MLTARPALCLALGCVFASCTELPGVRPAAADMRAASRGGIGGGAPFTHARGPSSEPSPEPAPPAGSGNVVLVTIDGVRWQEIFGGADSVLADAAALPRGEARTARGMTPNLHRLFFDEGVVLGDPERGEAFRASGPNFVSLPGYVEIMTGAASGCTGNDCEPRIGWAIAGSIARSSAPEQAAAVFASWERIARAMPPHAAGLSVHAGRAGSDEAPPWPGTGEYLPDQRTAGMAIDHLVRHRPRFLWVALGDTDEWAHRHDYRGYVDSLRFADGVVGEIAAHLAEMGDYGAQTSIFVTTDHGRDADFANHGGPASGSVWLMARGGRVAARGATPLSRPRHLRDIAPTIATLLGVPSPKGVDRGEVLEELL